MTGRRSTVQGTKSQFQSSDLELSFSATLRQRRPLAGWDLVGPGGAVGPPARWLWADGAQCGAAGCRAAAGGIHSERSEMVGAGASLS